MARTSEIAVAASGVALAAVLAACGTNPVSSPTVSSAPTSSSAPPLSGSPAPTSPAPTTTKPDDGLCKAKDLKLSLGRGGAAAGTTYRPLLFTNVSDHDCTIQGFPGVSYVSGADGHQVGAAAYRDGTKGPAIKLGKGQVASADIGFATVANYDEAICNPEPVRGLRVFPPQERDSLFIEAPGTGCANDKIPGNQLLVRTLQKGAGE
ncbi:DUF4232 domain-containing protein [Amycolatopsis sp. CA-230715]|uniref:DUF4232 domain-containing protein n=1 Tax=Amycolatopsis sp. CA-230715 TaxID=2745196 RepID=UPI001C013DC9|nr:DUF4232 domain-containing protein [Amycolatopsis sp. CA-230715]QWF80249.1 hypothetical protein HUW46_03668 [Amycolatopsis sp. CA-230715]